MPSNMPNLLLVVSLLLSSSQQADARKGRGGRRNGPQDWPDWNAMREEAATPCNAQRKTACCGDGICAGGETMYNCLADCPGINTDPTCGQEPRSDRAGRGLTFGVSHRASSAQDCCDKCKAHAKLHADSKGGKGPCSSWTFCDLPVCWGLDTGCMNSPRLERTLPSKTRRHTALVVLSL